MSNPISVVVLTDTFAQFLARTNQFGESNQDLIQQKFNKKQATGASSPVFAALESRSRSVAQWPNLVDDFVLASMADNSPLKQILTGTGSPEGVVTANVGILYTDLGVVNGDGPTLYSKEDGTGNTGWVPMAVERAGALTYGRGPLGSVTLPGGTTTLTADAAYQDLTIPSGAVLETAGFRVWARDFLDLQLGGTIQNAGSNAVATVPGAGAAGGTLGPGTVGGTPDPGFGAGGVGGAAVADTSGGAAGGAGGAGSGGAGGAAGTLDPPDADQGSLDTGLPHLGAVVGFGSAGPGAIIIQSGGTGGGAGAGDGASREGGGGGGGGGLVLLSARRMVLKGTVNVSGGDGDTSAQSNTGGGGGGGGGLVVVVSRYADAAFTIDFSGGLGGASGTGTGVAGTAGSAGSILFFQG